MQPIDLVQYGAIGLLLAAMLGGLVWSKPAVDQLKDDKKAAETQRDQLIETYESRVIPVLTDVQREFIPATSSLAKAVAAMQSQASKERRELLRSVEALQIQINSLNESMRSIRESPPPPPRHDSQRSRPDN